MPFGILARQLAALSPVPAIDKASAPIVKGIPRAPAIPGSSRSSSSSPRRFRSATTGAAERTWLMRLAWDVIGTEFAGRHLQHEKFYGGASHVVKANLHRGYDFTCALATVNRTTNLSAPG